MKRGRPLSPVASAVLSAIRERPRTPRQIAADLQLSNGHALQIAKRLVGAGRAQYGQKMPGLHDRPARVLMVAAETPILPTSPFRIFR